MSNVLTFSRHDYKAASRHKRPVGFPQHQFYIENDINIAASAEKVWQMLTNPEAICHWDYEVQDTLTSHGYRKTHEDMTGIWRMLFNKNGTVQKQIITECEPERVFAYTTIKGLKHMSPHPRLSIELHIALFRLFTFETEPGEYLTNVTWLNYVEFSKAGLSGVNVEELMGKLDRSYRKKLIYLKWRTENGAPVSSPVV